MTDLSTVRADLVAEQAALDAVVAGLGDADWPRPTPSPRWTVADQIAHLAYFDRTAATAITDPERFADARDALFANFGEGDEGVDRLTLGPSRSMSPAELLDHWRSGRLLLAEARRLHEKAGRRIPTAELNRWLEDATARHQPALGQRGFTRRPIRFFYATQTSATPPSFVLFCTDPRHVKEDYRRYLENRLREAFGYQGVPVRLRLRARRERS
ncbi:MAG: maleylpyruvate isomerase N-terminal domain-containing protein [Acidimicrobiales bacterium]